MNKSSIKFAMQYVQIFLLYLYVYSNFIVRHFGYMGYVDKLSYFKISVGVAIIFLTFLFINKSDAPSNFFMHLVVGLVLVPSLVIFAGSDLPLNFIGITWFAVLIMGTFSSFMKFKIINVGGAWTFNFVLNFSVAFALFVISLLFLLGGGAYFNLDVSRVYEFRDDSADNLPGIFRYITPVLTKVIIPFGVVLAYLLKSWLRLGFLIASAVLMFGFTAHKAIVLYPLIALFFYEISKNRAEVRLFIISLLLIGVISILEFIVLRDSDFGYWFSSMMFRRAILTSSLLNSYYIEWFNANSTYFWAESRFTFGLIDAPSSMSSPNLIGYQYFGLEDISANTGWIGSGFANAGIAGVFLYSILIAALLGVLNTYSEKLGGRVITALFSTIFLTLILSADFATSLLTHGLIAAIVLLVLLGGRKVSVIR